MRLVELKPEWEYEQSYLYFVCPTCPAEKHCRIMIPTKITEHEKNPWGWNGETDFDKVTLTPSIWHHCDSDPHFFIRDGAIQFA
jgi:hypothetical protein